MLRMSDISSNFASEIKTNKQTDYEYTDRKFLQSIFHSEWQRNFKNDFSS